APINRRYPGPQMNVETDGARIILSGVVASQKVIDDVVKLARLYSPQVVNSLTLGIVEHDRQVLLEVRFAEVDRSRIDQLGINIISTGATNTVGAISTQQFSPATLTGTVGTGETRHQN